MSKHSKIGIKGEQIAVDFLLKKGYIIVACNWRSGHKEVDILAFKDDILAVIEVKARTGSRYAYPEEAVTKTKQNHLRLAAEAFAAAHPQYRNIRFDIISISFTPRSDTHEIIHFEEAFW